MRRVFGCIVWATSERMKTWNHPNFPEASDQVLYYYIPTYRYRFGQTNYILCMDIYKLFLNFIRCLVDVIKYCYLFPESSDENIFLGVIGNGNYIRGG